MKKGVRTAAKIIAKILEVCHWVGTAFMIAIAVCSKAMPNVLKYLMDVDSLKSEPLMSFYGFEVQIADNAGQINSTVLLLFSIGAVIVLALMAMVFRNIYLIFKRSETGSPFQKDNIRMVREIGIFCIAVPVIGLFMSGIIRLIAGMDFEMSVSLNGVFMGIIVLCLTEFFAYGAQLEKDVDGLL